MDIKINPDTVMVFDLDDTLFNEVSYLKSAYVELAKQIDFDNWKNLYNRMFSMFRNRVDVFSHLQEVYGVSKDDLLKRYRGHHPDIELFEGALPLLNAIKEAGGKLALITDGRSVTQRNKINALGIEHFFDEIVISEELGSEKPDPKNYQVLTNQFGSGAYYYFGDNLKKDFITPNMMGWTTVCLVDNGMNIHKDSYNYMNENHLPKHFILNLTELRILQGSP